MSWSDKQCQCRNSQSYSKCLEYHNIFMSSRMCLCMLSKLTKYFFVIIVFVYIYICVRCYKKKMDSLMSDFLVNMTGNSLYCLCRRKIHGGSNMFLGMPSDVSLCCPSIHFLSMNIYFM